MIKSKVISCVTDINPYSAETDFSRQILTSKVDPGTVRVKIYIMDVDQ